MTIKNSIIIYLDNSLKLFCGDIVKLDNEIMDLSEFLSIEEENGLLNLADRFEMIWGDVDSQLDGRDVFFLIGPRARFTDTRIVYTWLQTKKMMEEFDFYITKSVKDLTSFDARELFEILETTKSNNSTELEYSKEPNIGKK